MKWTARVAVAGVAWVVAGTASAQLPDLNLMALDWLRGRFASPIVCEVDGQATPALRRVVVAPGPRHARPPVDRLAFHGIDVERPSRCSDTLGVAAPEVRGNLQVTLPGMSRPDLAQAEFQRTLRSQGGFDFQVTSGTLRIRDWGEAAEPRLVDFAGGTVRVRQVRRGTDADRILAPFVGRKLTLEADAPSGERLFLHLVLYDHR